LLFKLAKEESSVNYFIDQMEESLNKALVGLAKTTGEDQNPQLLAMLLKLGRDELDKRFQESLEHGKLAANEYRTWLFARGNYDIAATGLRDKLVA
jgi:hypothetical protein